MIQRMYQRFITPQRGDEDAENRQQVLHILLAGAATTMVLALLILLQRYFVQHAPENLPTILSVLVMLAATVGIYALSRQGHPKSASFLFVLLYFLIAVSASIAWGLAMPSNIGLFSFIIVLCGILIGARYSLVGFVLVVLTFITLRLLQSEGVYHPNLEWTTDPSGGNELTGLCLMLGVIAIVSWLFNVRMERSLHRAERAERALQRQKAELEKTVAKRTRELQEAQLEKVQELYRFAELGQISTALMHELANHLTTLTIDIESLEAENRSRMLQRAKRSMHYIDKMVLEVRDQLRGKTRSRTFNALAEVEEAIGILQHKALQSAVRLEWQPPTTQKLQVHGDPLRLRQMLANIISNAIDSYGDEVQDRRVVVGASEKRGRVQLTVEDWGRGIPDSDQAKLFDPFFGTKKRGLGLGLFIARQIARDHFGGDVGLDTEKSHTVFVVTLKAAHERKR